MMKGLEPPHIRLDRYKVNHAANGKLNAESRILVTGGAGFIGSALVWGLNRLPEGGTGAKGRIAYPCC